MLLCTESSTSLTRRTTVAEPAVPAHLSGASSHETQLAVVKDHAASSHPTTQTLCESWTAPASNNTAGKYGGAVAYPPARVVLTCGADASASHTCTDRTTRAAEGPVPGGGGVDVQGFWSTSDVDEETGRPLARLLLHAELQDMLGQVMPIGTPVMYNHPAAKHPTQAVLDTCGMQCTCCLI